MIEDDQPLLFVYGTLLRGEPAHHLLEGAPLIASAHTAPNFRFVELEARYPALVDGGTLAVSGEIYRIREDLLERLDRYEDAPDYYQRRILQLGAYRVFAYVLRPEYAGDGIELSDGDWRRRKRG
ncbi:MAG: gamma-glutamylcyclotransferase [Myxococcales bacterium]|nr:gamma-glutamylcyclotransferase [Myxococcales bacterium]